jgi:hypothetical protein
VVKPPVNECLLFNGIPDDIKQNLAMLDDLGSPRPTATIAPAGRWRSTRRSRCESATSSAAARRTVHHFLAEEIKARGEIGDQYHHAMARVASGDGWTAVTAHPTMSGWSQFGGDAWELYHADVDRSEATTSPSRTAGSQCV